MMKRWRTWLRRSILFFCIIILLSLNSCDEGKSPSSSDQDKLVTSSGVLEDPGPGNLAGTVVGTISNQPLGDVTVTIGSHRTTTDIDGNFRLDGVGEGQCMLNVSDDQVYPRRMIVNPSNGRVIQVDAIEMESVFDLAFYRELARGNHPEENDLLPIHRWTDATPPTFYIDTNASAVYDGAITQDVIDRITQVIIQILPVFSGNVYTTAQIEQRSFTTYTFDAIPDNSIVISFDDTLFLQDALGVTFTEPDFTSPGSYALRKAWIFVLNQDVLFSFSGVTREGIVAHELGHGFGCRHTSVLPSIMAKAGRYDNLFSEDDRTHMAVMYQRPAGNTDIDNDPLTTGKSMKNLPRRQVFIDRRIKSNPPSHIIHRLQTLQGLADEFFQKIHASHAEF